jgi:hypothetical protein
VGEGRYNVYDEQNQVRNGNAWLEVSGDSKPLRYVPAWGTDKATVASALSTNSLAVGRPFL